MLRKRIFDSGTRDVRGILALDLTKAFDTVCHRYILQATAGIGFGVKLQAFVRSFLVNRTACIQVEQIRSSEYRLGPRGTPQESVISPLLFNVVMKGLSDRLGGLRGIGHALYADDIKIWCPGGSLAEMEQALQAALDVTETYLADTSFMLSSIKSELLLYRPARQGVRALTPLNQLPVALYTSGQKFL